MKNIDRPAQGRYSWKLNLDVLISELDNIMDGINESCFDHSSPVGEFPALFIRGGKSNYIADADMNFIKKLFPAARLATIPDAGHWLHAEKPGAFIEVRNFHQEGKGIFIRSLAGRVNPVITLNFTKLKQPLACTDYIQSNSNPYPGK
jgi:hypothetical protein